MHYISRSTLWGGNKEKRRSFLSSSSQFMRYDDDDGKFDPGIRMDSLIFPLSLSAADRPKREGTRKREARENIHKLQKKKKKMMMRKRVENSKFSVTCSLLSQYLKEKGSLAAINGLEMIPAVTPPLHLLQPKVSSLKTPTTLNLLPGVDASAEEPFSHRAGSAEESNLMPPPNKEAAAEKSPLPPPPPLTIFYDGKVVVFNDIPADKAEGLMKMASNESAHQKLRFAAATNPPPPSSSSSASKNGGAIELPPNGLPKPNASDMPIARRNSLHRFLEKRKDRITTKAPYYILPESPALALAKTGGHRSTSSWLGLGQQASS